MKFGHAYRLFPEKRPGRVRRSIPYKKRTANVITDVREGSIGRRSSDGVSNVSRVTRVMVFKVWDALLANRRTACPANVLYFTPALMVAALDELLIPVGDGEVELRQQLAAPRANRVVPPMLSATGEEKIAAEAFVEGAAHQVLVNGYERNSVARSSCISHYGTVCLACGFDFERVYGRAGAGFTHVHHLVPLSSIGKNYAVNPVRDLRPVCANCHAIIHRRTPPFSIAEIKELINAAIGCDKP